MKVTLFYNQTNRGWTETWYKTGIEPPLTLPTQDKQIFAKAIAFRAPLTTLEWVRYSVIGKPQLVNSFRLSQTVASTGATDQGPDVVSTDALYRLVNNNFARRTISLRGLYDLSVERDPVSGAFRPSAFLTAGVNAYLGAVKAAGWFIRQTQTATNTPGLEVRNVTQFISNVLNPNQTDVKFITAMATLVQGNKVRFTGTIDPRTLPLLPLRPTVVSYIPGAEQFTINYQMPNLVPVQPVGMLVNPLGYTYTTIASYDFQSLSKRDTGRPFGSGRGRRTALGSRR